MWQTLAGIDWMGLGLWIVAAALIIIGLAGTIIPALPGIPMIFAGAWVAAWIGHFEHIGWVTLTLLAILTVLGLVVDWVAQTMGAKKAGASKYGLAGTVVGTVIGMFMGIVGIFLMPLVGAFVGEIIARRDVRVATNVGWATWIGMLAGTVLKLALSFTMIGIVLFALWV